MSARLGNNIAAFSVVRDMLLEGNNVTVSVQGNSMLPFFRSGSTVTLRPVCATDFKMYSVVFADAGNHFVIHRIIGMNGNMVTLLGDGNVIGTETMSRDKVYGTIDCSSMHLFFAKIWFRMRAVRKYPLAVLRRIF